MSFFKHYLVRNLKSYRMSEPVMNMQENYIRIRQEGLSVYRKNKSEYMVESAVISRLTNTMRRRSLFVNQICLQVERVL